MVYQWEAATNPCVRMPQNFEIDLSSSRSGCNEAYLARLNERVWARTHPIFEEQQTDCVEDLLAEDCLTANLGVKLLGMVHGRQVKRG